MAGGGPGWAPAVLGLWLLGSGFVAALLVRRRRFYRRALVGAGRVEPAVVELVERWRELLGVRRRVAVIVGERRLPPFTVGVVRPVIFLPRALVDRGGAGAVEAAVAHEMAHVARFDALWLALQNAVAVVWFFNPLARAAAARLLDARERAADELVVARGAMPPRRYAAGLVAALSLGLATPGGPPPAPALGSSKRGVSVRIQEILRRRPGGSKPIVPSVVCGLAAVLLLPLAAPAGQAPAPPAPPPALAAPVPEAPQVPETPAVPPVPGVPPVPAVAPVAPVPAVPAPAPVVAPAPVPAPPAVPAPAPVVAPAPVPAPPAVPAPVPVVAPAPAPAPPAVSPPSPAPAPAPAAAPSPALANPLPDARITSRYGDRKDPKDGRSRLHRGLDLAAPAGTPVHAPAPARVRLVAERYGEDGRFGKTVVLDHGDGLETLYAHLGSISVAEGERIEEGAVIGAVGSTGVSSGPHLHLEVLQDGRPLDPTGRIPGLSDR